MAGDPAPIGAFHTSLPARPGGGKRCRAFELLEIGYHTKERHRKRRP